MRILNLLCTQSAKKNWCGRKKTLNFFVVSVKNIIQHHHYDDYRWLSLTILSSPVCFFSFVFFFNFFVKFLFEAIAKGDAKGLYSWFFLLSLRLYEIIKYTYKYLNGLTLNWSYQNPERKKRLEFHARNIQHTIRMYFNIFSSRFCVFIYKMILMLFMIFFPYRWCVQNKEKLYQIYIKNGNIELRSHFWIFYLFIFCFFLRFFCCLNFFPIGAFAFFKAG